MFYVYVLKSQKNNRYYTGSTERLEDRFRQHNDGKSNYDKLNKPFKLLYHEVVETRTEAVRREMYFKTGVGWEELKKILGN